LKQDPLLMRVGEKYRSMKLVNFQWSRRPECNYWDDTMKKAIIPTSHTSWFTQYGFMISWINGDGTAWYSTVAFLVFVSPFLADTVCVIDFYGNQVLIYRESLQENLQWQQEQIFWSKSITGTTVQYVKRWWYPTCNCTACNGETSSYGTIIPHHWWSLHTPYVQ
jgi:hypothetical protein